MGDSKSKAQRRREFPPIPEPLPYPAVDNHTHLESVPLDVLRSLPSFCGKEQGDEERRISQMSKSDASIEQLRLAAASGIDRIVQVGCDIESANWTVDWLNSLTTSAPEGGNARLETTERQAKAVGAIAIHPNEAVRHAKVFEVANDGLEPHDEHRHEIPLAAAIEEIAKLAARNHSIRAIGETGMDLFRAGPKGAEVQRAAFREHIALAKELDLALQIHDREAHLQVIETLLTDGAPAKTVFHCFSGDAEMAKICAENGWYLSFAGPVTYRANEPLRQALRVAPSSLILAETDAPYLTPHPYRGQPNAPYVVNYTIREMAEIKEVPLETLCQTISENSETVYGPW